MDSLRVNQTACIPMMHSSIAASYVGLLGELGAPVENGLERAGLPVVPIVTGSGFVPCKPLFAWISDQAERQGIDDFGLRAVKRTGLAGLQSRLVTDIAQSPTLLTAMHLLCRRVAQASSHAGMWLDEQGDEVRFCMHGSFSPDTPGQSEMVWWALGSMCNVVRLFAGPVWIPKTVGVVGSEEVGGFAESCFDVSGFAREQPFWWISVPRYMLVYPRHHLMEQPSWDGRSPEDPPPDLAASVRYLLRQYRGGAYPRVDEMAEITAMPLPELVGHLAAAGQEYPTLVEEARFEWARERLGDPAMSIGEVAAEAGYRDPIRFAQAFRRFTGMSPSEYRAVNPPDAA